MKLAKVQKKILNHLFGFVVNNKPIFCKQSTIAFKCKCTREHVNKTLALFKKIGLIKIVYQGRKSPRLIKFLKHKNEIFSYVEFTSKFTAKGIEDIKDTSYEELAYFKEILNEERKKDPVIFPIHLRDLGISYDQKLKLSLCSESAYQLALERAKKLQKGIKNIPQYVVGAAISIEIQRGTKLNWSKYYANRI